MGNIGIQLYSVREAAKFMGVEQEDFDQDCYGKRKN